MHDDAVVTPGRERLAIAFGEVLRAIDATERTGRGQGSAQIVRTRLSGIRRSAYTS